MANVTVEVVGNAQGSGGAAGTTAPRGGTMGGGGYIPDNDRMVADIRREMQQRGVMVVPGSNSFQQLVSAYRQSLSASANQQIDVKYDEQRRQLDERFAARYDEVSSKYDDPLRRQIEQGKIGKEYRRETESLANREEAERSKTEEDLTKAMQELVEHFKREEKSGGEENADSYLGRLRAQQKALIMERDMAQTEGGAIDASQRLAVVNEQIRRAMGGGTAAGQSENPFDRISILQGTQGLQNIFGALQSGDIGSAIMGTSMAITGFSGMGLKAAMKTNAVAAIIAATARALVGSRENYERMALLAPLVGPQEGVYGGDASLYVNTLLENQNPYSAFGIKRDEFATMASQRIRQRGTTDNWLQEVRSQIGMERALGLGEGSLGQAGGFDRYGVSITSALTDLVGRLSSLTNQGYNTGVSWQNLTLVNEKLDIQQELMRSYMSRADIPDYNVANTMLTAFSSVQGIAQDSRLGGDIAQFQSAIQNPMNDRMKTLIYSTIEDIMPETAGRLDLMDRALRDPKNEGRIMQAVIQRITQMYGGTDTQMGYFAMKQIFPGISPDRLDAYMKAFTEEGVPKNLLSGKQKLETGQASIETNIQLLTKQAENMTTAWTEMTNVIGDKLNAFLERLTGMIGNGTR